MVAIQWNADDYARNSRGQFGWALSVIERLRRRPTRACSTSAAATAK